MKTSVKRLAESAMLIAIGTVLSLISFQGPWALGGGITVCAMLPLVLIAHRYGTGWGIFSALVFSVLQLVLGMNNVQYAPTALSAAGIILLDYILAFTVMGCSACFNRVIKNRRAAIVAGICVCFLGRYLCHFLSGVLIWEAMLPNELGWASWVWSLAYNGSFLIPEMLITAVVAALSYKPLEKYWLGEDLQRAA